MKAATGDLDKFQQANKETFDSFKQVGAGITAGGVAIATGLGAAVKSAAGFDTIMRKAGAIAGATTEEFDAMKSAAIQLGADTSKSAGEVAESMTEMAAKGFSAMQVIDAMPGVIAASEASGESLALTADTVASALNVWGLEASEASRVADVLAMSANVSAAGIDDLGYVLKYAGAPAAALGISLEELAAAAGLMTDAGLDGSNAGTSLRASLLALNNPAKAQAKIMKQIGFSMQDTEGNAKSLSDMIRDMTSATEGMTEAEKVATIGKLVGTEAVSGFLALMKAGPDAINANTAALENSAGASQEAADKMMAGIGGAWEEMMGAFESAAILIGDQLVPYVQQFAEFVGELVDKFNSANPVVQQFAVIGTAVAAALMLITGPILLLIGFIPNIIAGFGAIATVFAPAAAGATATAGAATGLSGAIAALAGPIAIAVAAIVGIGAALVLAYNKVDWFRDMVDGAWKKISEFTRQAFEVVKQFLIDVFKDIVSFGKAQLDKFKAFWDENGKAIMTLVKIYFTTIWELIKGVMGIIKGIFETVWPIISGVVKIAWNLIKTIVSTSIDLVLGIIQTVMKLLQGDWEGAWDTIKTTAVKIVTGIVKFFKDVDLLQVGKDILQGLVNGFTSMVDSVTNTVKNIASKIKNAITDFFDIHSPSRVMKGIGEDIGEGLAIGVDATKAANERAITGVAKVLSAVARNSAQEIEKIDEENEKNRVAIKEDFAKKREELERKTAQSIQSALKTHKNKKGEIVTTGTQKVHKIQADAAAKLAKLNDDEQKKLIAANDKAWAAMQKKEAAIAKERLEAVKTYVADKKSLDELSLVAESEVWRKSLALFAEGTKERVEIQRGYQAALKAINDEVTKTNEEYAGKMTVINDKLREEEKKLTDEYEKSLDDRAKSLQNFIGVFDFFEVKIEKTGGDLLDNLKSQVNGFVRWQQEITLLANKAIDGGLLDELRAMGPKALPELIALNSMTDSQLSEYSALYKKKSELARQQAEKELVGMKADTKKRIDELRATANTELEALRKDWVAKVQGITKASDDELMTLKKIGRQAAEGLKVGLESMEPALVRTARSIANSISSEISKALQVKSPSRVMMRIGGFVGEGLMVGMENMLNDIKRVAGRMGKMAVPEVPQIAGYQTPRSGAGVSRSVGSSVNSSVATGPGISVTLNYSGSGSNDDAMEMVDIIERELGSRVNSRLRWNGVKG
nr:phage tail tape measure protein [Sporosarcina sp. ACRSL]